MPEEEKQGICPICDSKVPLDASKCPECKADLSLFGIKTEGEEEVAEDIDIPDEESIEALLGEFSKTNGVKGHELFDEIMAAVDKTEPGPLEEPGEPAVDEKIEEVKGEVAEVKTQEPIPQETPSTNVAQDMIKAAEAIAEAPAETPAEPVMFECPLCNTLVSEDASTCPGCGAIFADAEEEEVPVEEPPQAEVAEVKAQPEIAAEPEKQPPAAKPEIPTGPKAAPPKEEIKAEPAPKAEVKPPIQKADTSAKEKERALRKELTKCVSDVKPLLAGARQYGINVLEGRKLIDRAIVAGKKRDFENAIILVKQSQRAIEDNFGHHIDDTLSQIQSKMGAITKSGGDVGDLTGMVDEVRALVNSRSFIEAAKKVRATSEQTEQIIVQLKSKLRERKSDDASDVNEKVENLVNLIKSGEEVKVNVKGAISFLTEARRAIKENNYEKAEEYLIQAKEDFLRELPKQITDIISSSKPMLYKAKMQGVDIRPSIKLLKEASTALKLNNYLEALDAIKRYRAEMNQYLGES